MIAKQEQAGVWMRSGKLIYSLMSDSWRKGVQTFRNRVAINIVFDRSVPVEEQEQLTQKLYWLLTEHVPLEKRPEDK